MVEKTYLGLVLNQQLYYVSALDSLEQTKASYRSIFGSGNCIENEVEGNPHYTEYACINCATGTAGLISYNDYFSIKGFYHFELGENNTLRICRVVNYNDRTSYECLSQAMGQEEFDLVEHYCPSS